VGIAGVGEAPRIGGVPPRLGGGGHAAERPDCLTVAPGPPAEARQDHNPGPGGPHPGEGATWPHCWPHRLLGRRQSRAACGCHLAKALGQRRRGLPRLAATGSAARRQRSAIPPATGLQRRLAVAAWGPPQAWRRAPPVEAVDAPRPRPFRGRPGALARTAIVCRHPRDTHAAPPPRCPRDRAAEPGAQLRPSEAIRLRSQGTPIACTAGRLHDAVLPPLRHSTAVAPAPLPAGLVTTDDAGVLRPSQTPRGPGHRRIQAVDVPGGPRAFAWPRRHPGREPQCPGRDAECKGQQPGRPGCRWLIRAGRRWCRPRWPPACVVQSMTFAAV
jgi:hypothetical protein